MNAPPTSDPSAARRLTFAVTAASVATAAALTCLKAFAWWAGGSVSVLASLADSALDVVAALATFVAVRVAAAPPDAEHRFGHGKAEAFSSLLQAGLVFATAALVGQEAVRRLFAPSARLPGGASIGVILISLAATGLLLAGQSYVLRRTRSVAVSGDRAHYAADLAANLAALVGVMLARATGELRWDAAAGLLVALWLVVGAVRVFREAGDHLMDRELDDQDRVAILACIRSDGRILGVHDLRTRASGPRIYIQMHVDLDPRLNLFEAHEIVEAAEERLLASFPAADVIIHPDPTGHLELPGRFGQEGPVGARQGAAGRLSTKA